MKILHLPFNIASMMATTVRSLRARGMNVRGLARQMSPLHDYNGLETMDWSADTRGVSRLARSIQWRYRLTRAVIWADVIHWHWCESTWSGIDLKLIKWLKKPALIEFYGDDLRIPEIAARDNPYIARMYRENPELADTPCGRWLSRFAAAGFSCLVTGFEMMDYLDPALFKGYYQTVQRLDVGAFSSCPPDPRKKRPVVVHAPSHKSRKGTEAVLRAMENLRRSHEFDFQLIHNMPRTEALEVIRGCDIFVDQFTIGGEGLAAHEAMAFGKPVVCFIKDSMRPRYPVGFPIVSATQDSLEQILPDLLTNGARRHELGLRGRAYVENHNDASKLVSELMEIYSDIGARSPAGSKSGQDRCRHWRTFSNS